MCDLKKGPLNDRKVGESAGPVYAWVGAYSRCGGGSTYSCTLETNNKYLNIKHKPQQQAPDKKTPGLCGFGGGYN